MQVLIVTVAEAQARLPELIARIAAGDQVVIAEGGKSVARLAGPPLFPTTPEEIARSEAAQFELMRSVLDAHDRDGPPLPTDHPLRTALDGRKVG